MYLLIAKLKASTGPSDMSLSSGPGQVDSLAAMAGRSEEGLESADTGTEGVATVNGVQLRYITRGNGPHPLLFIPGGVGTPEVHFPHQLEHFGREGSGFTVVSFDPRGYGTSQKITRSKIGIEPFLTDAKDGCELMQSLSLHPFSILGLCNGGVAGILLASLCPEAMRKLVLLGTHSYITAGELEFMKSLQDISTWDKISDPIIKIHGGPQMTSQIWKDVVDNAEDVYTKNNGDFCTSSLSQVSCPTLIVQGAKDKMCLPFHGEYLRDHVTGSQLVVMEQGGHKLHMRLHQQFNQLVEDFLTGTAIGT